MCLHADQPELIADWMVWRWEQVLEIEGTVASELHSGALSARLPTVPGWHH